MPTATDIRPRTLSRARRLVAVAAGASLGFTGAFAMAGAQDDASTGSCRPTEADLLRAADAARHLEAQRPDLFAQSPHPAGYDDLRLAAEWARRLETLDPSPPACAGD